MDDLVKKMKLNGLKEDIDRDMINDPVLYFTLVIVVAAAISGIILQYSWNYVMPDMFGLRELSFTQALAMMIVARIIIS